MHAASAERLGRRGRATSDALTAGRRARHRRVRSRPRSCPACRARASTIVDGDAARADARVGGAVLVPPGIPAIAAAAREGRRCTVLRTGLGARRTIAVRASAWRVRRRRLRDDQVFPAVPRRPSPRRVRVLPPGAGRRDGRVAARSTGASMRRRTTVDVDRCSGCGAASSPASSSPCRCSSSVAALVWLFRLVDGFVGPFYAAWLGRERARARDRDDGAGVLLVGAIATNVVGKRLLQRAEWLLLHVPLFRSIYAPVKQLVVAFSPDNEYGFKRVVLVEDAARGFVLGFLTREFTVDRGQGPEPLVAVYVPTNHLYLGDIVICPRDRASFPDITVEQGIRIFLTGGMALSSRDARGAAVGRSASGQISG